MARQNINIGTAANDGTGDPLRTAFGKVNSNFTELYGAGYITSSSLPTAVSELTNDTGYITANSLPTSLSEFTNDAGYITANEAEFITANSLPTSLSELTNDVGFITANSLPTAVSELTNDTGFITANTGYIILNDRYTLGAPVSFSNVSDTSLQDEIGPGLAIKRDPGAGGIYNPYQEVGYDQTNRDSPLGTEWNYEGNGFGNLDTVKNRYYTTFSEALKHQIGRNIIGAGLIMHDTINDKYYKFEFTNWGQQGAGTFAYTRTEIIPQSVGVEFPDGSIQPTAWTGYLNRYNKVHVGPYSGHVLSADEAGSVIYFFNTHVILPNNEENGCPIGSFYTLVVGDTAASLRLKKYANTATITTVESAIEPDLNVGPFNDTDYPLDPYSVAHLIKIERNKWSLVPAGIQTTITGEVFATTLTANSVISDVVPAADSVYDLGSPTNQWRSLYVSANTIFIGGTPISVDAGGNLLVSGITNSTSNENLRVESGKISLNSSKSDSLYADTGGSYTSASWSGNNIDFTAVDDIYLETLLERFFDHFDGSGLPWNVGYSNITVRINDTQTLTVTGAEDLGGGDWRVTVAETPDSDPTAVTSAEFLYDFLSTLEFDRDNNSYAIALDDSNFRVNTRRDIRLESGDDIYIDGRSNMRLRNYSRTSGITIETDFNDGAYEWLFDENGTLTTAGDITVAGDITGTASASTLVIKAEPDSNTYIQLNDTVDSVISTVANLEIVTDASNTPKTWTFDTSGGLTFPDTTAQTTAFTLSPTLNVLKIDDGVHEKFQPLADAANTVTHDCSEGHIFYHTSPDDDWTVNLTNLNLASGYATTVTIVIVQGGTGYYPSALEIGGSAQTINWQGNATPTPSTNRTDVVSFSIINNTGTYTVLGQLTGF